MYHTCIPGRRWEFKVPHLYSGHVENLMYHTCIQGTIDNLMYHTCIQGTIENLMYQTCSQGTILSAHNIYSRFSIHFQ